MVSLLLLYKATLSKRKSAESKSFENKWEIHIQGHKEKTIPNELWAREVRQRDRWGNSEHACRSVDLVAPKTGDESLSLWFPTSWQVWLYEGN